MILISQNFCQCLSLYIIITVCVLVICCSLGYRGRWSVGVFIEMVIGYILKEKVKDMTLSTP